MLPLIKEMDEIKEVVQRYAIIHGDEFSCLE